MSRGVGSAMTLVRSCLVHIGARSTALLTAAAGIIALRARRPPSWRRPGHMDVLASDIIIQLQV